MKRILTILILFVCGTASAQVYQRMPQYGYEMQRAKMDSVLQVPGDTVRNKTGVARIGTKLYAGNGTQWTAAGGFDTAGIRYRPTAGDGISITGSYPSQTIAANPDTLVAGSGITLSPSGTKKVTIATNTANLDSLYGGKLDSVVKRGDTLRSFARGDSTLIGTVSGGNQNLASVTANGNSTTDTLNILDAYGNRQAQLYNGFAGTPYSGVLRLNKSIFGSVQNDYFIATAQNISFRNINNGIYGFKPGSSPLYNNIYQLTIPDTSGYIPVMIKFNGDTLQADQKGLIDLGNISGLTTTQLTDSLNAREPRYKFRDDSTGNGGYTTLYQRNKLKDSLQVNINLKANIASPTFTGALALSSTTGGISFPQMTDAQMNAITPAAGTQVFNTTYDAVCTYTSDFGWWSNDAAWQRANGFNYHEEFLINTTSALGLIYGNFTGQQNNSSALQNAVATSNRPGILQLSTQTSATGRPALVMDGVSSRTNILGGGKIIYETQVQIPTLSSASETFNFFTGLSSSTSNVSTNAIAFLYDSAGTNTGSAAIGRWQVVCSNGSNRSYTTTNVQVTAGQWYSLRAVINAAGTQVDFYINGTLVKSETNNIPTGGVSYTYALTKTNGTTARAELVDYFFMRQKFTTTR